MKDQIIRLLARKDYVPANVPELLRLLHLSPKRQQELQAVLRELEQSGAVARIKGNRYVSPREADLIPGRIRMNRAGKGFLQPDDSELERNCHCRKRHRHGVARRPCARAARRARKNFVLAMTTQETGTVVRILERKRTQIVGTLQRSKQFLYVVPDDPRIPHDIYVSEPRDVGRPAHIGDKVVVELREWESRNANPEGEIVEVLGAPDEEGVDMLSVLRQYDLPLHFPKNVLAEAHAIGTIVDPHDLQRAAWIAARIKSSRLIPTTRKILTTRSAWNAFRRSNGVCGFISPTCRITSNPAPRWTTRRSKRGNSTYLVDRVIPMLPEALSNELCSLKPNVDRLTKCVEFLVSNDGRVLSTKFYSAVIHSQRRFTYARGAGDFATHAGGRSD